MQKAPAPESLGMCICCDCTTSVTGGNPTGRQRLGRPEALFERQLLPDLSATVLAPMERLEKARLADLVREQYGG